MEDMNEALEHIDGTDHVMGDLGDLVDQGLKVGPPGETVTSTGTPPSGPVVNNPPPGDVGFGGAFTAGAAIVRIAWDAFKRWRE